MTAAWRGIAFWVGSSNSVSAAGVSISGPYSALVLRDYVVGIFSVDRVCLVASLALWQPPGAVVSERVCGMSARRRVRASVTCSCGCVIALGALIIAYCV